MYQIFNEGSEMWIFIVLCAAVSYTVCDAHASSKAFTVNVTDDGRYSLNVDNVTWLQSGPTFFNDNATKFSTEDNTLKLSRQKTTFNGSDGIGPFLGVEFQYMAATGEMQITIKDYSPLPYVVFEQKYLNRTTKTKNKICPPPLFPPVPYLGVCFNETISGFPSFLVQQPKNTNLGFLSLGGMMFGNYGKLLGKFIDSDIGGISDGMLSGPLAVFDDTGYTLLISPLDKFMSTSLWYESAPSPRLSWGIMGGIDEVPEHYTIQTVVVREYGINKAFQTYGNILRKLYMTDDKRNSEIEKDFTVQYLGYWTDNGAFYYYNPGANQSYDETILDIKQYSLQENIPYRYLQIDSWWYYKSYNEGVKEWSARPDVFPNGIQNLSQSTNWQIAAHNRYWSNDTVYAIQNGGRYNFIKEYIFALPNDKNFWNDLFYNATRWGLILYEQDWLNVQTLFTGALQTNLTIGEKWLTEMGNAASKNGIALQYCMSLPRHALHSLLIPQVTQVRVSNDYLLDTDQWKIGISSMFAYALNVRPYKDTFWTSRNESGNPRYHGEVEPSPALQAVVSTLTTGPVGPGDKINMVNRTLIMRCCNENGLILKPSKPATAIDKQIIKTALPGTNGPNGEVWTTFAVIRGMQNVSFGIILAADLKGNFILYPNDTGLPLQSGRVISYKAPSQYLSFDASNPLSLIGCTVKNFCVYYVSPKITLESGKEVYILGETSKWVPVSPQRIVSSFIKRDTIHLMVRGKASEMITMNFIVDDKFKTISCILPQSGVTFIDVVPGTCTISKTTPTNKSSTTSRDTLVELLLLCLTFVFKL